MWLLQLQPMEEQGVSHSNKQDADHDEARAQWEGDRWHFAR